jgi:hypothetical protein
MVEVLEDGTLIVIGGQERRVHQLCGAAQPDLRVLHAQGRLPGHRYPVPLRHATRQPICPHPTHAVGPLVHAGQSEDHPPLLHFASDGQPSGYILHTRVYPASAATAMLPLTGQRLRVTGPHSGATIDPPEITEQAG